MFHNSIGSEELTPHSFLNFRYGFRRSLAFLHTAERTELIQSFVVKVIPVYLYAFVAFTSTTPSTHIYLSAKCPPIWKTVIVVLSRLTLRYKRSAWDRENSNSKTWERARERETDRQTGRQTGRQAGRQADRQRRRSSQRSRPIGCHHNGTRPL